MKAIKTLFKLECGWVVAGLLLTAAFQPACAYQRYVGGCSTCHGQFTSATSPQGTVFPSNNKHTMHRNSSYMATECELCHRGDDSNNPYIGSSDGFGSDPGPAVPGLGCTGCHVASGLRAHHVANGVNCYGSCHSAQSSPAENVSPPYYGTPYTKAQRPENPVPVANTNENWSLNDFLGLDNDGNNLYDMADFSCGPYQILEAAKEGNNMRVHWRTAGGRRDVLQAAPAISGTFTDVSSPIAIPGTGIVNTNFLDIGGATNKPSRYYRLKYTP